MKHTLAVFIAAFLGVGCGLADDYLDWTSTQGTTIRAKFVEERDGKLTLLRENGSQLALRRDQLDEASRKQVDALLKAREAKEREKARPNSVRSSLSKFIEYKVPTFEDGPWKGYHAVYEREKFVAAVEKRGHVRIYMKKDGERIKGAPPCRLRLTLHYAATALKVPKIRTIETEAEPSTEPKKLTFSGKTEAGSSFQVTYLFEDDTIAAYGHVRDRGNIEHPTVVHIGMRFLPIKEITPRTPIPEIRKIVGDSLIVATKHEGGTLEFDFVEEVEFRKHEQFRPGLESVTVKAAVVGPHLVKFEAPDRKHGPLRIWNPSHLAPHTGFSVLIYRDDPADRSSRARFEFTIE